MADKIKIVMIDDEEDLCMLVKANLEETGEFEVATLSDPKEAENFVSQQQPDLILLDVVMPSRRGDDVVQALRAKGAATSKIPIIMVSGKGEMIYNKKKKEFKWMPNNPLAQERGELPQGKSAESLSASYGVDDYISKPFATDVLVPVIKDVIKRSRKTADTEEPKPEPGV